MGLFKRVARKVRHIGSKVIEQVSIGARKVAKTAKRAQPILATAGKIATMVGSATGQPEIIAVGEGLGEASVIAGTVGKVATTTRSGVEKLRSMDTAQEGVKDLMGAGQEAYGMFGKQ